MLLKSDAIRFNTAWGFEDVSCRIHDFLGEMHHATKNTIIHARLELFGLQNNLSAGVE
jgi:hypothetical protein